MMERRSFYTNLGPPLNVVLRELVGRLVEDDWNRCETTDGIYYIIG